MISFIKRFFHLSTIIRRKRNRIEKLSIDGDWRDDCNTIKLHIQSYFNMLFAAPEEQDLLAIDFPPGPMLSDRDATWLNRPINWREVKSAVFGMQPLKAPGLDGFQPKFYQHYWERIALNLIAFVKKCFTQWIFPKKVINVL